MKNSISLKKVLCGLTCVALVFGLTTSSVYAETDKSSLTYDTPIELQFSDDNVHAVAYQGDIHFFSSELDKLSFIKDYSENVKARAGDYKSFLVDSTDSETLAWIGAFPPNNAYNAASSYTLEQGKSYTANIGFTYYNINGSFSVSRYMSNSVTYSADSNYLSKLGVWCTYTKKRWKHVTYDTMGHETNVYYSVSSSQKGDAVIGACYKEKRHYCGLKYNY